jgi:hypothetical protein
MKLQRRMVNGTRLTVRALGTLTSRLGSADIGSVLVRNPASVGQALA